MAQKLLVGLLEILDKGLLVGLRIVNQTTQFIEALLPQAMENNVDRRALFAHKEHPFSARNIVGDQVGDGL